MRLPSKAATNAKTAINPTKTQFTVDKSREDKEGIVCSWPSVLNDHPRLV
jgi:hypothetical protein